MATTLQVTIEFDKRTQSVYDSYREEMGEHEFSLWFADELMRYFKTIRSVESAVPSMQVVSHRRLPRVEDTV